ncbi:MAG: hypothetical protein IH845_04850 [Nanoarchaeota archaeon]|nr:hypothetical protein [Nanoarchaeota archaeon]
MRRRIIYSPLPKRQMIVRRPMFTPLAQDVPQQPITKQILDYLRFGKPITAPVKPIETKIIVPPETRKFAREIVFILGGTIIGGIVLYQILK